MFYIYKVTNKTELELVFAGSWLAGISCHTLSVQLSSLIAQQLMHLQSIVGDNLLMMSDIALMRSEEHSEEYGGDTFTTNSK